MPLFVRWIGRRAGGTPAIGRLGMAPVAGHSVFRAAQFGEDLAFGDQSRMIVRVAGERLVKGFERIFQTLLDLQTSGTMKPDLGGIRAGWHVGEKVDGIQK